MSHSVARTLRTHWAALALALIASTIVAAPQVAFRLDTSHVDRGIELLPDSPWAPRVREVLDGHPGLGSVYYADGKDDPYLFQPLGTWTVAYLGEAFHLSINNTLLLSRIVLPFAVVLLVYSFVYLVSGETLIALAVTAALAFADEAMSSSGLLTLLHGTSPSAFLAISRPVYPDMTYILTFAFLIPFWIFYIRRDWRWGALAALILGANFYNYFYSWTFLYAFGAVLGLVHLVRREWRRALEIAAVYAGALLVAVPYFVNLYRATHYPTYAEVGARFGVLHTHAPLFVGWLVLVAVAALLIARWRASFLVEARDTFFVLLALAFAPFITMNQQLLSGKVLQTGHYHWYFDRPVALIILGMVVFALLTRAGLSRLRIALALLVVAGSLAVGVFVQGYTYTYGPHDGGPVAIERQAWGPVMDWLNAHATPDQVVLANNEASNLVTIYTPLDVVYHRAAMYMLPASEERLLDALFMFYRLRGVGAREAHDVFYTERESISANLYGVHYRDARGSYGAIPSDALDSITAAYEATLVTPTPTWLSAMLKKYHAEYVIWDTIADPLWQLDRYPFLHKEAEFGTLRVYRVV